MMCIGLVPLIHSTETDFFCSSLGFETKAYSDRLHMAFRNAECADPCLHMRLESENPANLRHQDTVDVFLLTLLQIQLPMRTSECETNSISNFATRAWNTLARTPYFISRSTPKHWPLHSGRAHVWPGKYRNTVFIHLLLRPTVELTAAPEAPDVRPALGCS